VNANPVEEKISEECLIPSIDQEKGWLVFQISLECGANNKHRTGTEVKIRAAEKETSSQISR
jgi:hypothetical protein